MKKWVFIAVLLLLGGGIWVWMLGAPPEEKGSAVRVTAVQGTAEQKAPSAAEWLPLASGVTLPEGTSVRTGEGSRVTLAFGDQAESRIAANSEVVVTQATFDGDGQADAKVTVTVQKGRVWSRVLRLFDLDSGFTVKTNDVVATVRGTAFDVEKRVESDDSVLWVSQSAVEAGDEKAFSADAAPDRLVSEGYMRAFKKGVPQPKQPIPTDSFQGAWVKDMRALDAEYLLNGQRVRLLDIVDLVLKSNIGTSRYTVIGQGTIDQMILAGPNEVKNLLDEASGVKTYYIRREKTLRRLDQTAQNLMRAEDLVAEIEPRLKSLRRQAKRMEERGEIETELKLYQREWYGAKITTLNSSLNGIHAQLETMAQEKKTLESIIEQAENHIESTTGTNKQELKRYQDLQQELAGLQEKKNKLLENMSLVRGKMESKKTAANSDPKSLEIELHALTRKIVDIETNLSDEAKGGESSKQKLTQLSELLRQVNVRLDHVYGSLSNPLSVDFEAVSVELDKLDDTLGIFVGKIQNTHDVETIINEATQFQKSFSQFKHTARELLQNPQASHAKLQIDLQELVSQKERLTEELNSLQLSVSKTSMTKEFLDRQLGELKQQQLNIKLELKKATSGSQDEFWDSLVSEEKNLQSQLELLAKDIARIQDHVQSFYQKEQDAKQSINDTERQVRVKHDELNKIKDRETAVRIEKAKLDTQLSALHEEVSSQLGQNILDELNNNPIEIKTLGLEEKIAKLKRQLDNVGGVDELTLQEYKETEARYTHLSSQIEDLKKGMQDLRQIIDELDEHIKAKFNESFHAVNTQFEQYFRMLFNGGRAYLSIVKNADSPEELDQSLTDDKEPETTLRPEEKIVLKYEKGSMNISGVDIRATPPGKKLSSIQALSGGERALTSIALLCSLLTCFPSPFVVLDEVDAALDEANTIRFGQILGTLAHQTQFITITHNRETMAQSNTLYGVTMEEAGVSKIISAKFRDEKAVKA
jgi:chromosome segregation protein